MAAKDETYLTREEAAQHLSARLGRPLTVRVLRRWAVKRTGPRYAEIAGIATYRVSDLDAWLDDQFTAPSGPKG